MEYSSEGSMEIINKEDYACEKKCATKRPPWSNITQPLLELIAKRLPLPFYLRFGAVCRLWHMALHSLGPQFPWIMLCHHENINESTREFFSLSEKKIYEVNIPTISYHHHCISSSQGWLLLTNSHYRSQLLVNPFIVEEFIEIPRKYGLLFSDFLFLSSPSDPDCIIILWHYVNLNSLLFYRMRDREWCEFEWKEVLFRSAIACKGKLYKLNTKLELMLVDVHNRVEIKLEIRDIEPLEIDQKKVFLVESRGDVLLVRLTCGCGDPCAFLCSEFLQFDIFRADLSSKMEWVKMESLDDRILFLSDDKSSSISVSVAEIGGRGNRICYIPRRTIKGVWIEYEVGTGRKIMHSIPNFHGDDTDRILFTPSLH